MGNLATPETNADDKRGQRLHVTPQSDMLAMRMTAEPIAAERAAFVTLTPVEQAMLAGLWHQLSLGRARAGWTSPEQIARPLVTLLAVP